MAPTGKNKKKSSSSSKAMGSIPVKQAPVKPSKPTKSKGGAAAASSKGPTTVYVVVSEGGYLSDGFHSSSPMTTTVVGVYYNENQAYAAGIRHLIQEFEGRSEERPDLREIAKTKTMPLKKRMEEIEEAGNGPDDEQLTVCVQKTELIPSQGVDEEKLLHNLKKPSQTEEDDGDSEMFF